MSWLEYRFNPVWIMIMFLIVGPFVMLWGTINYIDQSQITRKCTAVTYGVVASVEMEEKMHDGNRERSYVATVKPIDSSIFGKSEIVSSETSYAFTKEQYVEIKYDPSDPSTYYIVHADPATGDFNLIIAGGVMLFIGLGIYVVRKRMKA